MDKIDRTEEQWRKELTPEQYRVLREKGTERAFSGTYYDVKDDGVYKCAGCGTPLFTSDEKYDSGSGWPSFYDSVDEGNITLHEDHSHGMSRVEITCANCGSHLGHVFEDGPRDKTGMRYCVNSASLSLDTDMDPAGVKSAKEEQKEA